MLDTLWGGLEERGKNINGNNSKVSQYILFNFMINTVHILTFHFRTLNTVWTVKVVTVMYSEAVRL